MCSPEIPGQLVLPMTFHEAAAEGWRKTVERWDPATLSLRPLDEPDALLTLHILPIGNGRAVWPHFAPHHYLTSAYHGHKAFLAVLDDGTPVAFTSSMSFPHKYIKHARREHRTVVLPDFQGLGIGTRLSEFLGDWHIAQGHRFYSRTSHPRMAAQRDASPLWRRTSKPGTKQPLPGKSSTTGWVPDQTRFTYAHEYLGRESQ